MDFWDTMFSEDKANGNGDRETPHHLEQPGVPPVEPAPGSSDGSRNPAAGDGEPGADPALASVPPADPDGGAPPAAPAP